MFWIKIYSLNHNRYEEDVMDFLIVVYRTLLFYIIITVIYRFMGKREIGQLGIVDLMYQF